MNLIFCKLKKAKKIRIWFFASLNDSQVIDGLPMIPLNGTGPVWSLQQLSQAEGHKSFSQKYELHKFLFIWVYEHDFFPWKPMNTSSLLSVQRGQVLHNLGQFVSTTLVLQELLKVIEASPQLVYWPFGRENPILISWSTQLGEMELGTLLGKELSLGTILGWSVGMLLGKVLGIALGKRLGEEEEYGIFVLGQCGTSASNDPALCASGAAE